MTHDLESLRIDPEERATRRRRAPAAAAVVVAVAVVVALGWWLLARGPAEVEVAKAVPASGSAGAVLDASGYVTPRRKATVSAKLTGRVAEVLVEEGDQVGEGEVLARLDDRDAVAELAAAAAEHRVAEATLTELEVELGEARRTLARTEGLFADGVASERELDEARTAADSLAAALEVAQRQVVAAGRRVAVARRLVDNHVIRAPFAGVVVSKDAQPGEMVSPVSAGSGFTRTGIATVVDMGSLEIEVDVNESYIARVRPGQPVEAVLDAYPGWRIPCTVLTVVPTADREKATVRVRIAFAALDPRILPDMGVRVQFLEGDAGQEGARTAVTVPVAAVRREGDAAVVYVVADGVIERRAVGVGGTTSGGIEVTAGLEGGEQVVIAGPERLRDRQQVRIVARAGG